MQSVRTGVITVAGLGTRFLPATKAVPKEMLPVLDKPVIQYIVEEMAQSGIRDIILVTSPTKQAIKDHFTRDKKLEATLKKQNKLDRIQSLIDLTKKVRFFYTYQNKPLGNGHALLCAKKLCGNRPFAFSDGDSIIDSKIPAVKQVKEVFEATGVPVIGVQRLKDKQAMTKYGNVYTKNSKFKIQNSKLSKYAFEVDCIKEKPSIEEVSPEGFIVGGMRYIFTPKIWSYLEKTKKSRAGEIWVADAVNAMAHNETMYAYEYEGKYFDTGTPESLLKTALYFSKK
ncbi:MAG: sugar phosphate nucleotidyltransferase [Candidatus Magasanikbacteria bacterium]